MSLLSNIRLALHTTYIHLTDDPVVFAVQISRRVPTRFVLPTARLVDRIFSHSVAPLILLATHLTGDRVKLEIKLAHAVDSKISGNRARLAADVALAAGCPMRADELLAKAWGAKQLQKTIARRRWYDGDMSGAVDALENQGATVERQRERLKGERRMFSGWAPKLPAVTMSPIPGRVLHLLTNSLPHTESGYAQRSHSTLLAQQKAGQNVLAVTRLGYPVLVGKVSASDEDLVDGVRYRRLLPSKLARTPDARLQQEAEELFQVALKFRPEVMHTTTHFTNGLVVGAVAAALGIPWVYEVRGQLADTWAASRPDEVRTSERYLAFREAELRSMHSASAVTTLGTAMFDGIVAQGIPAEKIILVPNAIGEDFLLEPLAPGAARRILGLNSSLDYIGTVSSLVAYEGFDDLIDAFAILEPKFPSLRLLLVGDGVAALSLKTQASRLGISEKVIFTGRVPRESASTYHQALSIFVVPRKDLAVTRAVTPLKPIEAMASARPVVASDLEALREIVEDGRTGALSRPSDANHLADVLGNMLNNPDTCIKMGKLGRRRVLRERTWSANAKRLGLLYRSLEFEPK